MSILSWFRKLRSKKSEVIENPYENDEHPYQNGIGDWGYKENKDYIPPKEIEQRYGKLVDKHLSTPMDIGYNTKENIVGQKGVDSEHGKPSDFSVPKPIDWSKHSEIEHKVEYEDDEDTSIIPIIASMELLSDIESQQEEPQQEESPKFEGQGGDFGGGGSTESYSNEEPTQNDQDTYEPDPPSNDSVGNDD